MTASYRLTLFVDGHAIDGEIVGLNEPRAKTNGNYIAVRYGVLVSVDADAAAAVAEGEWYELLLTVNGSHFDDEWRVEGTTPGDDRATIDFRTRAKARDANPLAELQEAVSDA